MNKVSVWEQLTRLSYLELYTKLVNGAMRLDVFSDLTEPVTAKELAEKRGWHEANTDYLLSALVSIGFTEKKGDRFHNSPDANRLLVKGKPEYLGGFIQYYSMNEGTMPMDVVKLVTEGPQPEQSQAMETQLDFEAMGKMLRQAQEGYRQQELLEMVRSLPENDRIKRVLDMGCATGLLGMAVIGDKDDRTGELFDQLPAPLLQESVEQAGMADRVSVVSGNFNTDSIGEGYDLILAIGVMLFAKGNMDALLRKCYDALNPGGVMLAVSEGIEPDHTGPWDMTLGYLPYYLQGMDMGVLKNEISDAAKKAGFQCEKRTELLCSGLQDIDILRKPDRGTGEF